jgi:hypothetical protein
LKSLAPTEFDVSTPDFFALSTPSSMQCSGRYAGLGSVGFLQLSQLKLDFPLVMSLIEIPQVYMANGAQVMMHEFGHNLGLSHSGSYSSTGVWSEYGDSSSNMGLVYSCFNLPYSEFLGFGLPRQISSLELSMNIWNRLTINAEDASFSADMRIQTLISGQSGKKLSSYGQPQSVRQNIYIHLRITSKAENLA